MNELDYYRDKVEEWSSIWFAALCLLFIYPVIAADILHRDDVWRVATGQFSWTPQGRPMADFATEYLSLSGSNIIDAAPFSQIIFGLCLFLSFMMATRFFQQQYGAKFTLPLAILFLNPFLLGNILYQYDSLGMGLGIALTVAAFVVAPNFQARQFSFSVLMLVIVLALYQPLLNLLIGLCAIQIAVSVVTTTSSAEVLRILLLRATQFIVGSLVYYIGIGLPLQDVIARSDIVSLDLAGIQAAYQSALAFLGFVLLFFQSDGTAFQISLLGFVVVGMISAPIVILRSKNRGVALFGFGLAAVVSIVSIFGPLILIDNMQVAYRTVPSSIAPLAVLAVFIVRLPLAWPVAALPVYVALLLSFQTMAAYKSQRTYDLFVAGLIAADLNAARKTEAEIFTFGEVPRAMHARLSTDLHPMIRDLTAPAKHWIFEGLLIQHGLRNTVPLWSQQRPALDARLGSLECDSVSIVSATSLYTILSSDQTIYVFLPGAREFPCSE